VLVSVLGAAVIQLCFQLYIFLVTEPFVRAEATGDADKFVECVQNKTLVGDDSPCSQNTTLYLISSMQYVISCVCFSVAWPFRKPIWSNKLFTLSLAILVGY
jgi:magnesium-transporting ATPase (P-type)